MNQIESTAHEHKVLITGIRCKQDELLIEALRQSHYLPLLHYLGDDQSAESVGLPDQVVFNLGRDWRINADQVQHAKRFGVPLLCTLPEEATTQPLSVCQLNTDDYVFRPYDIAEVVNRIEVLQCHAQLLCYTHTKEVFAGGDKRQQLRRGSDRHLQKASMEPAFFRIDDRRKLVFVQGRQIHLTPREYSFFSLLASEPGRVFSVQEILAFAWQGDGHASLEDVQQYVHLLRKKIESNPRRPRLIANVKGFGYCLNVPSESGSGDERENPSMFAKTAPQ